MSDRDGHLALIADLQERLARTRAGGGERAMQRHVEGTYDWIVGLRLGLRA